MPHRPTVLFACVHSAGRSQIAAGWLRELAVLTMGCGDACPYFPRKRYEDWALTDPAGKTIEVVREVRDEVKARVAALVAELRADIE